ncbi:MAG: efflux RND transporter periplasmic adaptor subunit [Bryobacteraceae bacterium]
MRRVSLPVVFFACLFLFGCSQKQKSDTQPQPAAPAVIAVRTAPVESRKVDRSISVTGSLLADESVALSSEVAGRVEAIYVDFGQPVKKGQVVAQLDSTEYRLQLERSKAALAQARAQLGLDPNSDGAPTDTAAIRQARAQMEDARFKYESAAKLVKTGDISQERFTELEKALHAREAALEASLDMMRTQWANIAGLKAEVGLQQKRINDCSLKAPFDAVVSEKNVSPGQYTKENTTILTLVKTNPLRLRAELPEAVSGLVKPGSTLVFSTDAAPGITFKATVRELNPSLDPKSRSLMVEARIDGSDARLRPGMFVGVRLVTQVGTEVTVVPEQALFTLAGLTKVFVVRDGKAREVRLTSPNKMDGWIEVPTDLIRPGETVAVSNLSMLIDGTPVSAGRS